MAECFWPGVTAQQVVDAGARVRDVMPTTSPDSGLARHRDSILIPAEEIALFLFDASSIDAAEQLVQQAAIPCERILEVLRLAAARRR